MAVYLRDRRVGTRRCAFASFPSRVGARPRGRRRAGRARMRRAQGAHDTYTCGRAWRMRVAATM